MKPLGLEGKVGAPAIVKANPLLKLFASFIDGAKQNEEASWLNFYTALGEVEYRWVDVLDVIWNRYPERRSFRPGYLTRFINTASDRCVERSLVYDLDTPDLNLFMHRSIHTLYPKSFLLRGACRLLDVKGVDLIVDGSVEHLLLEDTLTVVKRNVPYSELYNSSDVTVSPDGSFDEVTPRLPSLIINDYSVGLREHPVVLADREVRISRDASRSNRIQLYLSDDPLVQDLYPDCLCAGEDPGLLLERSAELRQRFAALRHRNDDDFTKALRVWCSTLEYPSLRDRMGTDPGSSHVESGRRFTPRGGS